jgi:hypothetical protein
MPLITSRIVARRRERYHKVHCDHNGQKLTGM